MAVNFYQAGNNGGTVQINGISGNIFGQDFAEQAVLNFKSAHMELEIRGKNSGIFIEHK